MALATATLIALGGAAVGGGMNLVQAAAARDAQQKADKAAGKLMSEAKRKLEKDFYEGLKIPDDAYEDAYAANIQTNQQNIEALQQADSRTLAAGVGKVGMAANQNTETIRAQQAKEYFALEKLKAQNKDDMNQQLASMDVAGAQDKAARAAQADEQVGMLQSGAASAVIGGITAATEAQALYPKQQGTETGAGVTLANKLTNNDSLSLNKAGNFQGNSYDPLKPRDFSLNMFENPENPFAIDSPLYNNPSQKSVFTPDVKYGFSFGDRMKSLNLDPDKYKDLKLKY